MKRAYYIFKFSLLYIWHHVIFRRNRTKEKPLNEFFFRAMESACANDRLAVDFEEAIIQMTTQFYADYLCDGAYTPINEWRSHLFFENMRQWINVRRGYLNGSLGMNLTEVTNDDKIRFGVTDEEGHIYIIGYETVQHIVISNTKSNERDTQEQNDASLLRQAEEI